MSSEDSSENCLKQEQDQEEKTEPNTPSDEGWWIEQGITWKCKNNATDGNLICYPCFFKDETARAPSPKQKASP